MVPQYELVDDSLLHTISVLLRTTAKRLAIYACDDFDFWIITPYPVTYLFSFFPHPRNSTPGLPLPRYLHLHPTFLVLVSRFVVRSLLLAAGSILLFRHLVPRAEPLHGAYDSRTARTNGARCPCAGLVWLGGPADGGLLVAGQPVGDEVSWRRRDLVGRVVWLSNGRRAMRPSGGDFGVSAGASGWCLLWGIYSWCGWHGHGAFWACGFIQDGWVGFCDDNGLYSSCNECFLGTCAGFGIGFGGHWLSL
ncbi:hypothetical protein K491DRAFT_201027 [Lophiostoma macrostomum CBS 122681]|uniref:Uncharacterized protein n=1 Tax=Lophiostoma macrostomum CBS 122681 TaxID=1314788 RepID=A0A6A6SP35_9PLEO|nr:hypothetical protein K491DRAFT_201027 [Lophiostoma macrostomum CBS 122681]